VPGHEAALEDWAQVLLGLNARQRRAHH